MAALVPIEIPYATVKDTNFHSISYGRTVIRLLTTLNARLRDNTCSRTSVRPSTRLSVRRS